MEKSINYLTKQKFMDVVAKYTTIFFDCDGVLWKSGKPIEGAF